MYYMAYTLYYICYTTYTLYYIYYMTYTLYYIYYMAYTLYYAYYKAYTLNYICTIWHTRCTIYTIGHTRIWRQVEPFPDQAPKKPETSMRFFWRRKHKVVNRIAYLILVDSTYYNLLILLNSYKESDFKINFAKLMSAIIIKRFLVFVRKKVYKTCMLELVSYAP